MSISADIDMASNHTCFQTRGPWQFLGAFSLERSPSKGVNP